MKSLLLSPIRLRQIEFRNRVMISPMCQYSAVDGMANDWHLVHLGQFALGGAGGVMFEATAVQAQGRITPGDLGLWQDSQVEPLARIVRFLNANGARAGIQLGHSGRKGSSQAPWYGMGPLTEKDVEERGHAPWQTVSSSPQEFSPEWPVPHALTQVEIADLVGSWKQSAVRAELAGFDFLEIHAGHGYLLHQFLSPLCNLRSDSYGGGLMNRSRLLLEVTQAVRSVWPEHKPLFVRLSVIDGIEGVGWSLKDSVTLVHELKSLGVDVIDCSSSGINGVSAASTVTRQLGFQVPLASAIRKEADIATMAVGLILEPSHAEKIIEEEHADLIAIGREALANPRWAARAAFELEMQPLMFEEWPKQYGWWLARRERILTQLNLSTAAPDLQLRN
ncbi:MAG: NADH:flavin oxidoreductase/NADH oxidase [Burkholderiaceae bacterium]|nr:NADH:flavin oxidoreductase/NADH oxidase [Burkholderiaceae bacterium]